MQSRAGAGTLSTFHLDETGEVLVSGLAIGQAIAAGREVTLSCVEGDEGHVYDGMLAFSERELDLESVPGTSTRVMMNIGSPAAAMQWWRLPAHGIGLARMEYLVNNVIQEAGIVAQVKQPKPVAA